MRGALKQLFTDFSSFPSVSAFKTLRSSLGGLMMKVFRMVAILLRAPVFAARRQSRGNSPKAIGLILIPSISLLQTLHFSSRRMSGTRFLLLPEFIINSSGYSRFSLSSKLRSRTCPKSGDG